MNCIRKLIPLFVFTVCVFPVQGNNVQIVGKVKVLSQEIRDNIAPVTLTVSWENSWQDAYNQDGVYLFLKYRVNGFGEEWHTLPLMDRLNFIPENRSELYNYTFRNTSGDAGNNVGLLLHPQKEGSGKAELSFRLYWDITRGERPLTTTDFDRGRVSLAAMAIEMVYIPKGAFYLGDSYSHYSFRQKFTGIPEKYDLVKEGYLIETKNGIAMEGNPPAFAANRVNDVQPGLSNCWLGDDSPDQFWRIDFGTDEGRLTGKRRKVKYIAIESIPGYVPARWQLYGSNVIAGESVLLYEGTGEDWNTSLIRTYPTTRKIAVPDTSATYRYYEIRITDLGNARGPAIKNISMAEADLDRLVDNSLLLTAPGGCFTTEGAMKVDHLYAPDISMEGGCLPVDYPNGYTDFWVMKYELSQEQYVAFLNHLTLRQQAARTIGPDLLNLKVGEFVYGEDHRHPSWRNGIVVTMPAISGQPVVFGHNLNEDDIYSSVGDGHTLACNYVSPADMLAYAEWCGLRPLTELEYEKMCHRSFPEIPSRGEYAWNTTDCLLPSGNIQGIEGDHTETPADGNVNAGNRFPGPLRTGSFARETSDQITSGATFWAVMDVSGNLSEICYNANTEGRKFSGLSPAMHGWGKLTEQGEDYHRAFWPFHADAFALKGGSFRTTEITQLASSDRTFQVGNFKNAGERRSDVTFRLGCSGQAPFTEIPVLMENGSLTMLDRQVYDTVCAGGDEWLQARIPDLLNENRTIAWFVSENQGKSWELLEGEAAPELRLTNIRHENSGGTGIREYWYRIQVYSPSGDGGSGVAVVRVIEADHLEYQFDRLADTLRVFDDAYGIELATTNFSSAFEWWCVENSRRLRNEPEKAGHSFFRVTKADLRLFDEEPAGDYNVYVLMKYSERCRVRHDLKIYAQTPEDLKDQVRIIRHSQGYRLWEDGTYAEDVSVYRNPLHPYVYAGDIGNGIYRINHPDSFRLDLYCDMENYTGTDIPLVRLGSPEGVRLWGDGTFASSMKRYKDPLKGYAYTGCTGTGIYRISPRQQSRWGNVTDVYCNMENYLGISEPIVCLGDERGVRLWGDLTLAASVREYKHPGPGYAYTGCIGDGVYRIVPENTTWVPDTCDFYCCMTDYTGNLQPVAEFGGPGGYRLWGDGSVAATVLDYKNPPSGYEYSGCVGTGLYRILNNSCSVRPLNVYCDWTVWDAATGQPVVRHDNAGGYRILGDGTSINPFSSDSQAFTYVSNERYQVSCEWDAAQPRTWSLSGAASGVTIDPASGVISGAAAICSDMTVTISCNECPDVKYTKTVQVIPPAPFASSVQTFTYNNSNTVQVVTNWQSSIPQKWTITNASKGDLAISSTGVVSGLNSTMCNITVKLESANCPDKHSGSVTLKETGRTFAYKGDSQAIKLLPGSYSMECKGAGGGYGYRNWGTASVYDHAAGGRGGYAYGVLQLSSQRTFYVYVGGRGGSNAWAGGAGGWNGGGHGGTDGSSTSSGTSGDDSGGGGGGASDIRLDASLQSRIIVAGGGGGGSDWYSLGGNGGGLTGGYGVKGSNHVNSASPGQQGGGYAFGQGGNGGSSSDSGSYTVSGGGGGGGWYGGYGGGAGNGNTSSGGGGGSSYVGGVAGCARSSYLNFSSGSVTGSGAANDTNGSVRITVN